MASRAKRYQAAVELVEEDKEYQPEEAVALLKQVATAKFDETVELHLRTGADPRHADPEVEESGPAGISILIPPRVSPRALGEPASPSSVMT